MTIKRIFTIILLLLVIGILWFAYQLNNRTALDNYAQYFLPGHELDATTPYLTAKYLGTSTVVISDGETSIMTDGFFTRPSFGTMLAGKMQPNPEIIRQSLKRHGIDNLAAVIPIHSHHDHAMDAPEVAKQTGAMVVGSESTANIARGWNLLDDQIVVPRKGESLTFGQFEVILIPSVHLAVSSFQKNLTGIGETIDAPMQFPAPLTAFKEGGSFSIWIKHPLGNVLVHGSAGVIPGALKDVNADVVFIGIAGVGKQPSSFQQQYLAETIDAVAAKTIIPIHWDDFNTPADHPLRTFPKIMSNFDNDMTPFITKVEQDKNIVLRLLNSDDILLIK
jgi:L-ascorbate metabolism protein UlaG (beta-lactamase superfamily)/cbb3-type cytochrome oxidase subunit 3